MEYAKEAWAWLKTAPLPVVLALNVLLGLWVYRVAGAQTKAAADQEAQKLVQEKTDNTIDKMDKKIDELLRLVLEQRAKDKAEAEAAEKAEKAKRR